MKSINKSVIIGGSGFIGRHLSQKLKNNFLNLDLVKIERFYQYADIRKKIQIKFDQKIDVIYNLAAIHTTPGHKDHEYFETNIKGATNVCEFARDNNINTIVFTSSISPYGSHEELKDESSLTMPTSAYGISKLIAEYIHRNWQLEEPTKRKLIILRPGVVFGENENGNFTRLYRAISKGLFFYPGRSDTKKACIYVKDLVSIMIKMNNLLSSGFYLYNMCYDTPYTIKEICRTISKITNQKVPSLIVPKSFLSLSAFIIYYSGRAFGRKMEGIHPERVKKLTISTNISGSKLNNSKFKIERNLEAAIKDWYNDCNKEGLY